MNELRTDLGMNETRQVPNREINDCLSIHV